MIYFSKCFIFLTQPYKSKYYFLNKFQYTINIIINLLAIYKNASRNANSILMFIDKPAMIVI